MEQVESFKFLGVHITKELTLSTHSNTVVKKAQQSLFPLRRLKRYGMGSQIHKKLYSWIIEHWLHHRLACDRKALQRIVRMAQYITGAKLPVMQDL